MTKHELIEINDFKVILNHDSEAKTTMVESYISNGFINENITSLWNAYYYGGKLHWG